MRSAITGESLQPRVKEAESISLPRFPSPGHFRTWMITTQIEISAASGRGDITTAWLQEIERPDANFESLANSGPIFAQLVGKIASAIRRRLPETDLGRRLQLAAERELKAGRMIKGRQCLFIIYQFYKSCEDANSFYELRDLAALNLSDRDLPGFLNQWEYTLMGMQSEPSEETKLHFLREQMLKSRVLREELAHYRRLPSGHPDKSYNGLLMAIRRTIEENRRDSFRQARFSLPPSLAAPFVSKPPKDRSGSP